MTTHVGLVNTLLSRWARLLPRAPGQLGRAHEADGVLLPLADGRPVAHAVDAAGAEPLEPPRFRVASGDGAVDGVDLARPQGARDEQRPAIRRDHVRRLTDRHCAMLPAEIGAEVTPCGRRDAR